MGKPGNPNHDPRTGEFTSSGGPDHELTGPGGKIKRYGKMSNRERAHLAAHAQEKSTISVHTGKVTGVKPRSIMGDSFGTVYKSPHAVAMQTSKALERDFQREREKTGQVEMHAAIARHRANLDSTGTVTKLPAGMKSGVKFGRKRK